MFRMFDFFDRRCKVIILGIVLVFCFSAPALGKPKGHNGQEGMSRRQEYLEERTSQRHHRGKVMVQDVESKEYLSPKEKAKLKKEIKKWKSLSPEKQDFLRHKMDQWKKLPPESRRLYRERFDQMQKLSPQERQGIQKMLENWDSLSPREKKKIRQRFKAQ